MMTPRQLVDRLVSENLARREEFVGLSERDIEQVLLVQQVPNVAPVLRDYLAVLGRSPGRLMEGSDVAFASLLWIKPQARKLLGKDGHDASLLADALVLLSHQGYMFTFVRGCDMHLPDPPVWSYLEHSAGPEQRWATFSKYLEAMLVERMESAAADRELGLA